MRPATCHPKKKHYGRGLCFACYMRAHRKGDASWEANKYANRRTVNRCHPDRKPGPRGLCASCYHVENRKKNPEKFKAYQRAYEQKNKERRKLAATAYREKHRDRINAALTAARAAMTPRERFERRIKRNFNLTPEAYQDMLIAQDGRCAICGLARALVIDHCHNKGHVRGLLCRTCNSKLGWLERLRDHVHHYLLR